MPKYNISDKPAEDTEHCYTNASFKYSIDDLDRLYAAASTYDVALEAEDKTTHSRKDDKTQKSKRKQHSLEIGQLVSYSFKKLLRKCMLKLIA